MTKRRIIPEIERKAIHYAWNHKCAYCRCELDYDDLHIDHVVPVALNGSCDIDNLVASCPSCNLTKSDIRLIDMYEGLILSRAKTKIKKSNRYLNKEVNLDEEKRNKRNIHCLEYSFIYCGFKGSLSSYKPTTKEINFMKYIKSKKVHDKEQDVYRVKLPTDKSFDFSTFCGSVIELHKSYKNGKNKWCTSASLITRIDKKNGQRMMYINNDCFNMMYEGFGIE